MKSLEDSFVKPVRPHGASPTQPSPAPSRSVPSHGPSTSCWSSALRRLHSIVRPPLSSVARFPCTRRVQTAQMAMVGRPHLADGLLQGHEAGARLVLRAVRSPLSAAPPPHHNQQRTEASHSAPAPAPAPTRLPSVPPLLPRRARSCNTCCARSVGPIC